MSIKACSLVTQVVAANKPMPNQPFPKDIFSDVLAANATYSSDFESSHLTGKAAQGLAIITCMDSRISPLSIVGMEPGDVKILRNAGARVTDDVLRTLVLATFLLGVHRVLVMPHTDCRMASATESEIHQTILQDFGVDTRSVEFRTVTDPIEALQIDVKRIRTHPFLAANNVTVGGAVFDVNTGKLQTYDF
jgi:carbonic anhydrase